jgi:hypothetical protein
MNSDDGFDSPKKKIRPSLIEIIQILSGILEKFASVEYKRLGFVSSFHNTLPTRIFCPKCLQHKKRVKSRAFKNTRQIAHHLVKVHTFDFLEYPTLQQSLQLVEIHSIMLQMKMVGI